MSDKLPLSNTTEEQRSATNYNNVPENQNTAIATEHAFVVPTSNNMPPAASNDSPPPSPKIRKLNRRSSIAVARRMSRASAAVSGAGGGLPLADQLALIPGKDEALPADRLRQIVNICVRTTCRTIESEERESGEKEDEAQAVSKSLIEGSILNKENLESMSSRLQNASIKGNPQDFITGRARQIQEYTRKLEEESKQWKQFLIDRNRTMKIEMKNLQEAKKGTIKVEDTVFYQLSTEEKNFLRQLPKIDDIVKSTQEIERNQTILDERMAFESTRLLGRIRGVEKELTATTRQLSSYANSLATGQGQDIMDILDAKDEGALPLETGLSAESA